LQSHDKRLFLALAPGHSLRYLMRGDHLKPSKEMLKNQGSHDGC